MDYVANPHSKNMVRYGRLRPNVMVLSGDLTGSTEISEFKKELPDQFVSMGMAEQNMLSWAGGMAREGYIRHSWSGIYPYAERKYSKIIS